MGKKFDGFFLSILTAAGFYLYFQRAFENCFISMLLAFMSFIVLRKTAGILFGLLRRSGWAKRRKLRRSAHGAIFELAVMPEAQAQEKLENLVQLCFESTHKVIIEQSHPALSMPCQRVFELWRENRNEESVILCATCPADDACRSFAASLKSPKMAILDAAQLGKMIAEHPEGFSFGNQAMHRRRLRLAQLHSLFFNRKNAPRMFIIALGMLGIYLLGGKTGYLIGSMGLVYACAASIKPSTKDFKLF